MKKDTKETCVLPVLMATTYDLISVFSILGFHNFLVGGYWSLYCGVCNGSVWRLQKDRK